jgi:predicted transcriptional regulator
MGRHRNPATHRQYQVEQLWDVHHEILRLALMGNKSVDIAAHLNISPVMVSYTLRSPLAARQLECMQADRDKKAIIVADEIRKLAPKALEVMEELLDDALPNIKLSAAKDILDRAGHAAVRVIKADVQHSHFTSDEISEIKQRAKDIGLLIDADYVEVPRQANEVSLGA